MRAKQASNRARSAALAEISGQVALLGAPQDGGGVKLPHARRHHGPAQRAPAQPREDQRIRLAIEHRVDVLQVDAAARQFGSVGRFAHVRFGAEQMRGLDHGLLEGQMLEGVQRVVMNENADRTLHGKQVRRVFNRLAQSILSRWLQRIAAHATADKICMSVRSR